MRYIYTVIVLSILTGCQGLPEGQNGNFYTWVDETGQIRTIQKPEIQKETSQQTVAESPAINNKELGSDFNPSDFISSDVIDKKLSNEKLYAWQDSDGRQVVAEIKSTSNPKASQNKELSPSSNISTLSFYSFREGQQLLLSEINGRMLDLKRYYQYSKTSDSDYLLIEMDQSIKAIEVKSFSKNDAIALPEILPLDESFDQTYQYDNAFNEFQEETWMQYAYAKAKLSIAPQTRYLLFKPSAQAGVIQLGGKNVKLSNLGEIVIQVIK
ncbi:MAG: hypothetical protein HWE18_13490 [Gammaproteobacteria bacterium]|nr:hypothetical protein [Gammaproteobacteria bacterium]